MFVTYTVNTLRIINAGRDIESTCHLIKLLINPYIKTVGAKRNLFCIV